MARTRRDKSDIFEQIEKMAKEDLVELLRTPMILWPISQGHLNDARAKVLRRKADAEFRLYTELKVKYPHDGGHLEMVEYHKQAAKRESHFQRYMELTDKADKLEFGKVLCGENHHAAE